MNYPELNPRRLRRDLRFDRHPPRRASQRTEDLFLDWFGSALAGKGARAVETIESFALAMGLRSACPKS